MKKKTGKRKDKRVVKLPNVAVDGPSGAGKSTVAKLAAARLGLIYVDTGALYRTVGLYMLENGVDPDDAEAVGAALPDVRISLTFEDGRQILSLGGEEVGDRIRTEDASRYASAVSKIPAVREFLLEEQQKLVRQGGIIMDGRDIGTVIMPDADVKIYYTAAASTRAERRYKEQREKGIEVTYEEVLAAIEARDKQDSEREIAPLRPADDAVIFESDDYTIEECVERVCAIIRERTNGRV